MGVCHFSDNCGNDAVVALTLLESTSIDALTELCSLHALGVLAEWLARPRDDWTGWTIEWLATVVDDADDPLVVKLRAEFPDADIHVFPGRERAFLGGVLSQRATWESGGGPSSATMVADTLEVPRLPRHPQRDEEIVGHCQRVLEAAPPGSVLHVALFGPGDDIESYGAVALLPGPEFTSTLQPTD